MSKVYDLLYKVFDFRFLYIGWSSAAPLSLKWGIAKNVFERWRKIGRSMPRSLELPLLFLPTFHARSVESDIHSLLKKCHNPIKGDGGTEFFTFIKPLQWPKWIMAAIVFLCSSFISLLSIQVVCTIIYCQFADQSFFEAETIFFQTIKEIYHQIRPLLARGTFGMYLTVYLLSIILHFADIRI